jgi:adenylate kinase family enzyme
MQAEIVDIIIIRGAPASGKSETAKNLAKFFLKGVRLEVDTLRQMVISVDWKNQEEHINILQLSTNLVYDFLKMGYSPVIVVDTFSGDKINKYLDTLYLLDKELSVKIFGLFTTDNELKRRLELRSNEKFKDFEICRKLNDDLIKIKRDTEFQINTTGILPKQTAEIVYRELTSNHTFILNKNCK